VYGKWPSGTVLRLRRTLIELAVDELERRLREQKEADAWGEAAADPQFQSEVGGIEAGYRSADRETWPA
jgi:hypothetical protein